MQEHVVRLGECIESIALQYGHFPKTLWEHQANQALRDLRGSPHTLMPGDVISIPEKREKSRACATGRKHSFRRRGVPARFRTRLATGDKPRAGLSYTIRIDDGDEELGTTDDNGAVEHWLPPDAERVYLTVSEVESYEFELGHLAPPSEESGARARLINLGFLDREEEEEQEEESPAEGLASALRAFQRVQGLTVSGSNDPETQAALKAAHGS